MITALILAAGLGTRLRPLTETCPKPLIPVHGKTMLERTCEHIYKAGMRNIAINTHYLASQIHDYIPYLTQQFPGVQFHLSHEEGLLDVGGGIKKVIKDLTLEEVLIFNADSLIFRGETFLQDLISAWDADTMDGLLYLRPCHGNESRGDFSLTEAGLLSRDQVERSAYIYTGIGILKAHPLLEVPEEKFHLMTDYMFPKMRGEHKFYGKCASFWHIDIGSPEKLKIAQQQGL